MFEEIGLGGVLNRYRLSVPPNQREYAWKKEHIKTLFHDIAKAINDDETEYFLGTIVGIVKSKNVLEIVDGQQRLATTTIFFCELYKYMKQTEPLIAQDLENKFLFDIDRIKKEKVVRMQLNVADNEFFKANMRTEKISLPEKPSHKLIKDAFEISRQQIKSIVGSFDKKDHYSILNKWIDFFEHRAIVILLSVESSANAYKMFETLNDRGLKTSQADLVKNYLFGQVTDGGLNEAQHKWSLMRGALESVYDEDRTVTFLRHALTVLRGFTREAKVFEVTQSIATSHTRALTFLSQLEQLSQMYVAVINPGHDNWSRYPDTVTRAIETLNEINIKPFHPILLAIAEKFNANEASTALKFMINLGIRLLVASRTTSGPIEEALSKAAYNIYNGENKNAASLKSALTSIVPNDKEFKQAFENIRVSKAKLARYYLRSLEMAAKNEPEPWFILNDNKEQMTLEHILPVNPEENWGQFNRDQIEINCKRLGNLALLPKKTNSNLKSCGFGEKKKIFKKSPYILTSQVASKKEWTEDTINIRQKRMAELALKAWPV